LRYEVTYFTRTQGGTTEWHRLVVQLELVKTQRVMVFPTILPAFKFALPMLSSVLRHPTRKSSQYTRLTLNPYPTIILLFLATPLIHHPTLETSEPWAAWELAFFFAVVPWKIMVGQRMIVSSKLNSVQHVERWIRALSNPNLFWRRRCCPTFQPVLTIWLTPRYPHLSMFATNINIVALQCSV
jgi:hypothetical protein